MSKNVVIITATLFAIILAAWLYLYYQHWQMTSLPMLDMWMPPSEGSEWKWTDFFLVYIMWAVMMAAMMLPSAIPMILVHATICEQRYRTAYPYTWLFIFAYLVVWLVFSVALTGLQWVMHDLHFLSPMMDMQYDLIAAIIFLIAGFYQFTPQKQNFLNMCRTPMGFVLTEWREGTVGAFRMGIKHGGMCLGCCWLQMLLMFSVGVMNLLGMVFITLLVFVEKTIPVHYRLFSNSIGVLFIIWAVLLLILPLLKS